MWPIDKVFQLFYRLKFLFIVYFRKFFCSDKKKDYECLFVCFAQYEATNMGNTKPKLHMRKLNKCKISPFESFGPLIKYVLNWKDGSSGPQANIKKYFTALTQGGYLFIFMNM